MLPPLLLPARGITEITITATYLAVAMLEIGINPRIGAWFDRGGPGRALRELLVGAVLHVPEKQRPSSDTPR